MGYVGIVVGGTVFGLPNVQAQFLAGQLERRLQMPEHIARMSDALWQQSSRGTFSELSVDIALDREQKRVLQEALASFAPEGDREQWDALAQALLRDIGFVLHAA